MSKFNIISAQDGFHLVGVQPPHQDDPVSIDCPISSVERLPIIGWSVDTEARAAMTRDGFECRVATPITIDSIFPQNAYGIQFPDGRVLIPEIGWHNDLGAFCDNVVEEHCEKNKYLTVSRKEPHENTSRRVYSIGFYCRPRSAFRLDMAGPGKGASNIISPNLPDLPNGWRWEFWGRAELVATCLLAGNSHPENGVDIPIEGAFVLRDSLLVQLRAIIQPIPDEVLNPAPLSI